MCGQTAEQHQRSSGQKQHQHTTRDWPISLNAEACFWEAGHIPIYRFGRVLDIMQDSGIVALAEHLMYHDILVCSQERVSTGRLRSHIGINRVEQ